MRRFTNKKSLWVLVGMGWISLPIWAQGYLVVLKSGQVYSCESKYTRSKGLVCFTETRGSEICVDRYEVDWYETARSNGETPPPGTRLSSGTRAGQSSNKWLDWARSMLGKPGMSKLQVARQSGLSKDEWLRMSLVVLTQGIALLIGTILLRMILGLLGEPVPFFKLLLYHIIVVLIHAVAMILLGFFQPPGELAFVLKWFLYAFVWTSILASSFEVDIPHAFLGTLFYCIVAFVLQGVAGFIVNTIM